MGDGFGRVTKHPDYYLSDGSVSFLTDNTLFRVHQSFFERESVVFRNLFANAAEDDPQFGTDACPFTLDVNSDEFTQLLWVWYDREYSYQQQTTERWVTILRLSTRWQFDKIRALAIRELDALYLHPAERISIYNEHGIDSEQLMSSYVEVCRSPTVPTEAEGRLMQMETLINLLQAREDAGRRAVELGHETPTSAGLEDETLREIISKLFKEGLNPRPYGASTGSGDQALDLNGERAHGTRAITSTITLGEPLVPDRRAQSASGPSHPNSTPQAGSEGKGNQERGKGKEAEKTTHENARENDEGEAAKALQDKEREEREERERQEKLRRAKEEEERVKLEKAKLAKEKEEKEALERKKQEEAEKAAREKGQGAGWKYSRGTGRGN